MKHRKKTTVVSEWTPSIHWFTSTLPERVSGPFTFIYLFIFFTSIWAFGVCRLLENWDGLGIFFFFFSLFISHLFCVWNVSQAEGCEKVGHNPRASLRDRVSSSLLCVMTEAVTQFCCAAIWAPRCRLYCSAATDWLLTQLKTFHFLWLQKNIRGLWELLPGCSVAMVAPVQAPLLSTDYSSFFSSSFSLLYTTHYEEDNIFFMLRTILVYIGFCKCKYCIILWILLSTANTCWKYMKNKYYWTLVMDQKWEVRGLESAPEPQLWNLCSKITVLSTSLRVSLRAFMQMNMEL